ncbi:MAG: hypothetical protein LASZOEIN_001292, partial [Candidatus Fervidibacter sp.]
KITSQSAALKSLGRQVDKGQHCLRSVAAYLGAAECERSEEMWL